MKLFLVCLSLMTLDLTRGQIIRPQQNSNSFYVDRRDGSPNPTCAKDGEYCQTHSDCCNRNCLSFSYKCVKLQQPSVPILTTNEANNRFVETDNQCAKIGEYCQRHLDCCSKSCLSFAYKCVSSSGSQVVQRPVATAMRGQNSQPQPAYTVDDLVNSLSNRNDPNIVTYNRNPTETSFYDQFCRKHSEKCDTSGQCCKNLTCDVKSGTCLDVDPTVNRFGEGEGAAATCKEIGEYCVYHEDCCSKACHGFLHKCVT